MKLIVLSLTAAAAVTVPNGPSMQTGVRLSGFTPGGLELIGANQNHRSFRQTGARASVRVVATSRPFSAGAR